MASDTDDESGGDSGDEKQDIMQSMLFGAIDEDGQVDAEYFDEDMKVALQALRQKNDLQLDIEGEEAGPSSRTTSAGLPSVIKASDAVDYENETDMIEDDEVADTGRGARAVATALTAVPVSMSLGTFAADEDDYDMDDAAPAAPTAVAAPPAAALAAAVSGVPGTSMPQASAQPATAGGDQDVDMDLEEELGRIFADDFDSPLPASVPLPGVPPGPPSALMGPPPPAPTSLSGAARVDFPGHTHILSGSINAATVATSVGTTNVQPAAVLPIAVPPAVTVPPVSAVSQSEQARRLAELGVPILAEVAAPSGAGGTGGGTPGGATAAAPSVLLLRNSELFPSDPAGGAQHEELDAEDKERRTAMVERLRQRRERIIEAQRGLDKAPAADGEPSTAHGPDDVELVLKVPDAQSWVWAPGETGDQSGGERRSARGGADGLDDDVGGQGDEEDGEGQDEEAGGDAAGRRGGEQQAQQATQEAQQQQQRRRQEGGMQKAQHGLSSRPCSFSNCSFHRSYRPEPLCDGPLVPPSHQRLLATALQRQQRVRRRDLLHVDGCAAADEVVSSSSSDSDGAASEQDVVTLVPNVVTRGSAGPAALSSSRRVKSDMLVLPPMLGYVPATCADSASTYCWEDDILFDVPQAQPSGTGRTGARPSGGGAGPPDAPALGQAGGSRQDDGSWLLQSSARGYGILQPSRVRLASEPCVDVEEVEDDSKDDSGASFSFRTALGVGAQLEAMDVDGRVASPPAGGVADEDSYLPSLSCSLEQLSRQPWRRRLARLCATMHPQMLRLQGSTGAGAASAAAAAAAATPTRHGGGAAAAAAAASASVAVPAAVKFRQYFGGLHGDAWLQPSAWDGRDAATPGPPPRHALYVDLNDPHAVFTARDASALSHAAALVRAPPEAPKLVLGPVMTDRDEDELARELSRFNTSNDKHYAAQRKARDKVLLAATANVRHATFAANLETLPILLPSSQHLATFHRPRATWCPTSDKPFSSRALARDSTARTVVIFRSLAGTEASLSCDRQEDLAQSLQEYMAAGQLIEKKFPEGVGQAFRLYAAGPDSGGFRLLDPQQSLASQGLTKPRNMVLIVFTNVKPLPTRIASSTPPTLKSLRPPGAFSRKPELVASDGHILLFEYLEEYPPLLARPGMGVKLQTYYKKKSDTDNGHQLLTKGIVAAPDGGGAAAAASAAVAPVAAGNGLWRVGMVHALGAAADDESPFLGNIASGGSQLSVESLMYRAPAAPHSPASSDFLLVRTGQGAMYLRELTGTIMVGQQQPLIRVPAPGSAAVQDFEDARLLAHVSRELRRKQDRIDKKLQAGEVVADVQATVMVSDLAVLFPMLDHATLCGKLAKVCGCQPSGGVEGRHPGRADDGSYQLREGVTLIKEGDLRKRLTPDEVCAHESMMAAVARLERLGLSHLKELLGQPAEHVKLAVEHLSSTGALAAAGAAALSTALHSAPWATTDAFVWAMREPTRGILNVVGPADPTGRGHGLSYARDDRKVEKPAPTAKKHDGTITGTESDLRKLSHEAAGKILLQFGMKPEMLASITDRWQRIGFVRELSSATPSDGRSVDFHNKYARIIKISAADQLKQFREAANKVFEQQLVAISEDRDLAPLPPDPVATAALKALAAAASGVPSRAAAATAAKPAAADGGKAPADAQAREEEEAAYRQMVSEGMLGPSAAAAAAAGKAGKVNPAEAGKAGERRLRRTIHITEPDGSRSTKEIIINDKADIALLNLLSSGREGGGFGERHIVASAAAAAGAAANVLKRKQQSLANKALKAGKVPRGGGASAGGAAAAETTPKAKGPRPPARPRAPGSKGGGSGGGAALHYAPDSPPPPAKNPPMRLAQRLALERASSELGGESMGRAVSRGLKCRECGEVGHIAGDPKCPNWVDMGTDDEEATEDDQPEYQPESQPEPQTDGEFGMLGSQDLLAFGGTPDMGMLAGASSFGPPLMSPPLTDGGAGTMDLATTSSAFSLGGAAAGAYTGGSVSVAAGSSGGGVKLKLKLHRQQPGGGSSAPTPASSGFPLSAQTQLLPPLGEDVSHHPPAGNRRRLSSLHATPSSVSLPYDISEQVTGGGGGGAGVSGFGTWDAGGGSSGGGALGMDYFAAQQQQHSAPQLWQMPGLQPPQQYHGLQSAASSLPKAGVLSRDEWRSKLNKLLLNALLVLKGDKAINDTFKGPVAKTYTPDYNQYVDAKDEMWLDKVRDKAKNRRYQTDKQFMEDLKQILRNAEAYSTPKHGRPGRSAHPIYPETGRRMVDLVHAEVQRLMPQIKQAMLGMQGKLDEEIDSEEEEEAAEELVAAPLAAAEAVWVACDKCNKWRDLKARRAPPSLIAQVEADDTPFTCSMVPGLICDEASEWLDPEYQPGVND